MLHCRILKTPIIEEIEKWKNGEDVDSLEALMCSRLSELYRAFKLYKCHCLSSESITSTSTYLYVYDIIDCINERGKKLHEVHQISYIINRGPTFVYDWTINLPTWYLKGNHDINAVKKQNKKSLASPYEWAWS